MSTAEQRLERLLAANRAIVGELSLPTVLRRVVEAARDLVGAHYAALGVIGDDGRLQEFIHLGADSDAVASISDLPQGLGAKALGGVFVVDGQALRVGGEPHRIEGALLEEGDQLQGTAPAPFAYVVGVCERNCESTIRSLTRL